MTKLYFKFLSDKSIAEAIKQFGSLKFIFDKKQDRVFSFEFENENDCRKALALARTKNYCLWKIK